MDQAKAIPGFRILQFEIKYLCTIIADTFFYKRFQSILSIILYKFLQFLIENEFQLF
jgi:hypothetical protein